eukprot:gene5720-6147_t
MGTVIYLPKLINGIPVDNRNPISFLQSIESPPPTILNHEDLAAKFQISTQPMQFIMKATYEITLDENHRFLSMNLYCYDMIFSGVTI